MSVETGEPEAWAWPGPSPVSVGGLSRHELAARLREHGVGINAHAETLLAHSAFDTRPAERVEIVARTVHELGLADGGTLPEVFAAAASLGWGLCPPDAAPYLRLAWLAQPNSTDSILSAGRSPQGALKVATAPISDDVEVPKGFYLRVVDGVPWLRGYRCDDEYRFAPDDVFAFRVYG
ncbi:hypothetical protein DEU37_1344 [Microbacterium sp. AG790]|uniref:hypothetical protein n=1 Tax=Microbacterium sp. AG790 TaxID=2183995 RepID=UPI000EB39A6B|nr:hypothetical protein [Microbacterium sp. AG790]RKS90025.1 hypothetical protein DEU37_1344 [Microbacterium sp. AG790]